MVGRKKREVTGMILNYFYAIGEALVALIAWLTRDWVLLQLSVSAPPILFVVYYWYVNYFSAHIYFIFYISLNEKKKQNVDLFL